MIPLLVEQTCRRFGLPSLSANGSCDPSSEPPSRAEDETTSHASAIANLFELTSRLSPRFYSARDTWALLQSADHVLGLEAARAYSERVQQALDISTNPTTGIPLTADNSRTWRLLVKAMDYVNRETSDIAHCPT